MTEAENERIEAVRRKTAGRPRPRVALFDTLSPLSASTPWFAELVTLAGGEPVSAAPDVLLLAIPDDATESVLPLRELPGWFEQPCVTEGEVYLIASPFLVLERQAEAAEIVATILHPDIFTEMLPPFSVQLAPLELFKP